MCLKTRASKTPGKAEANTGDLSGGQGGKSESTVMATGPETSPNSQSTVHPASATVGGTTPLIPQAVKGLDPEVVGVFKQKKSPTQEPEINQRGRPSLPPRIRDNVG